MHFTPLNRRHCVERMKKVDKIELSFYIKKRMVINLLCARHDTYCCTVLSV